MLASEAELREAHSWLDDAQRLLKEENARCRELAVALDEERAARRSAERQMAGMVRADAVASLSQQLALERAEGSRLRARLEAAEVESAVLHSRLIKTEMRLRVANNKRLVQAYALKSLRAGAAS